MPLSGLLVSLRCAPRLPMPQASELVRREATLADLRKKAELADQANVDHDIASAAEVDSTRAGEHWIGHTCVPRN